MIAVANIREQMRTDLVHVNEIVQWSPTPMADADDRMRMAFKATFPDYPIDEKEQS